jgi:hypothetical protein
MVFYPPGPCWDTDPWLAHHPIPPPGILLFYAELQKVFHFALEASCGGPPAQTLPQGVWDDSGEKIGAIAIGWLGMGAGWYFGMRERPWAIYMFAALALIQLIAMLRIKTHRVKVREKGAAVDMQTGVPKTDPGVTLIESVDKKEDRPVEQSSRIFTSSK